MAFALGAVAVSEAGLATAPAAGAGTSTAHVVALALHAPDATLA